MTSEPSKPTPPALRWRLFPAVAIIAIGLLLLTNNLGYDLAFLDHHNWWAVIILLAALAPLTHAFERYRTNGRIDAEAAYSLLGAVAVVLVGVLFLFDLAWGTWWPLFVILGGLYTLLPYRPRCHRYWHDGRQDDATAKH